MKDIHLIYDHINASKVDIKKNYITIKVKNNVFNSQTLVYLASKFKFLFTYRMLNKTILIDCGEIKFADKITYLLFDALLYDLLKRTKFKIEINLSTNLRAIHVMGFNSTALYRTAEKNGKIDKAKFIDAYEKQYYANTNVYRRLLTSEVLLNTEEPSIICSELSSILKQYSNDEKWIDDISEVISELLCNVSSHTDSDCLIDIDFSSDVNSKDETENKKYMSINVAVINFSENRLFDLIKTNLKEKKYECDDVLYNRIYKAYDVHNKFFDDNYDEDDFFMITAFQNHVTSRYLKSGSGGTGLPRLIETIIGKTQSDYSYVLSGRNILFFDTEYLKITEEKFIGFNKENDYFTNIPAREVINKSNLYIPGSIYNLLLIKEN